MTDADLVDLLPHAVVQLDASRRIVATNAELWRLTGYPPEELIGRAWPEAVEGRAPGAPAVCACWHPSAHLRSVRALPEHDLTIRTRAGADVLVTVSGSYQRDRNGALTGAVLAVRLAGRRRAPSAGLEIVSMVSHELRSPITSVKGYTRLLITRWPDLTDGQKLAMLQQVDVDADRVTRLITELLDVSRLESGRLVLRRQPVDLAELAGDVARRVGLVYPELEARLDFPSGLPKVFADPDKIERVLVNLVENACKYASPKGLSIEGAAGEGEVSVTVTDRGEGIPASDLPKVFTKFFRRFEGRPTGSGLGLWISRGMVEAHGGRLVVDSIPGRGTAFRFTLPVDTVEGLDQP
jgi:PAS domain S-box-containing protein